MEISNRTLNAMAHAMIRELVRHNYEATAEVLKDMPRVMRPVARAALDAFAAHASLKEIDELQEEAGVGA